MRTMDNEVMHSLEEECNRGMLHDDYDGDLVQNDHNCGIILADP